MTQVNSNHTSRPTFLLLAALLVFGSIAVIVTTAQEIDLGVAGKVDGLTKEETTYYEYVAPRLDRLVQEVDDVVVMVEAKSRDIVALTISASRIEQLAANISSFGADHGVPDRFQTVHSTIVSATETATFTFDQARKSLRTFDFSRMADLIADFQLAADGLHRAEAEMESIGGTGDAESTPAPVSWLMRGFPAFAQTEQEDIDEV